MAKSSINSPVGDGGSNLTDSFGRTMKYLRVSLTDRCNFRCTYCRPEVEKTKRHEDLLTFEEMTGVVAMMVRLGITKVRLTGGEPLVRKGAVDLVRMLADIPGIQDLAMTTNAVFLDKYAVGLKEAGLNRINVSLDTLNPERFAKLTGGGDIATVFAGIDAAVEAGLLPIKLNAVLMKGFNDDEAATLIDYASKRGFTLRFIECMPMRDGLGWDDYYISAADILKRSDVAERVDASVAPKSTDAPSLYLPLKDGSGEVGFIAPMSKRFCDACNRLRLTADGRLRSCLPADKDVDLKAAFVKGADSTEIEALIRGAVLLKPESGEYNFDSEGHERNMVDIGG
ncbi:MAG: GTP 3',8-cyclase MoaA [Thermodesulfobacteriota bacterium]